MENESLCVHVLHDMSMLSEVGREWSTEVSRAPCWLETSGKPVSAGEFGGRILRVKSESELLSQCMTQESPYLSTGGN